MLMSIFCWVLLGLMAGLVASKVGMGRNEGMALDLALGVIRHFAAFKRRRHEPGAHLVFGHDTGRPAIAVD